MADQAPETLPPTCPMDADPDLAQCPRDECWIALTCQGRA